MRVSTGSRGGAEEAERQIKCSDSDRRAATAGSSSSRRKRRKKRLNRSKQREQRNRAQHPLFPLFPPVQNPRRSPRLRVNFPPGQGTTEEEIQQEQTET